MRQRDREEFKLYLRQCSDAQVRSVFDREKEAFEGQMDPDRLEYVNLAKGEAERRGLDVSDWVLSDG